MFPRLLHRRVALHQRRKGAADQSRGPVAQSGEARDLPHRHTRAEPTGGALLASRGAPTEPPPHQPRPARERHRRRGRGRDAARARGRALPQVVVPHRSIFNAKVDRSISNELSNLII